MKIKTINRWASVLALAAAAALAGCARTEKSPDVSAKIRAALEQSGLKTVTVTQDRIAGVVTLTGQVPTNDQKTQAESIAKPLAEGQVVADEIAVLPPGNPSGTKAVDAHLDNGITQNLDAALIQNHLHDAVRFTVREGVVTLTGNVNSEDMRTQAQQVAAGVPNVQQVVNEIQLKNQKATTSD